MGRAQQIFLASVLVASFAAPAVAETPPPIIAPEGERFTLTSRRGRLRPAEQGDRRPVLLFSEGGRHRVPTRRRGARRV